MASFNSISSSTAAAATQSATILNFMSSLNPLGTSNVSTASSAAAVSTSTAAQVNVMNATHEQLYKIMNDEWSKMIKDNYKKAIQLANVSLPSSIKVLLAIPNTSLRQEALAKIVDISMQRLDVVKHLKKHKVKIPNTTLEKILCLSYFLIQSNYLNFAELLALAAEDGVEVVYSAIGKKYVEINDPNFYAHCERMAGHLNYSIVHAIQIAAAMSLKGYKDQANKFIETAKRLSSTLC